MRHIRIERATLLAGAHAEIGSVHHVDTDTADTLVRHGVASEHDGAKATKAKDAAPAVTKDEASTPAKASAKAEPAKDEKPAATE